MRVIVNRIVQMSFLAVLLCTWSLLDAALVTIDAATMRDKVRGGWVGQTVGVCYGAPTEFHFNGRLIPDQITIDYNREILIKYFNNDDLYMDFSFLAVFDSLGLDVSTNELAVKFANAGFWLGHANQAGRWNILHGIMPPESGYWKNNPHADDIDFQIEADFIGLMTPGMPNTALQYCDRVGHIMNYGDGFYGGVFVAAMYSHAFVEDDIPTVIESALKSLPEESNYYKCIADVLRWWREFPGDWKQCWFEVAKKWDWNIACPQGVMQSFNIDAKINGAYIALGLLYGKGDFSRTIEITTRCGQDSDCNPSNAAGILGTIIGFDSIPDKWKIGLNEIEDSTLDYCDYSLSDAYEVTCRLASNLVELGGGKVTGDSWTINIQQPIIPAELEVSFDGLELDKIKMLGNQALKSNAILDFTGRGCTIQAFISDKKGAAECEFYIDDIFIDKIKFFGNDHDRRDPFFWNYDLAPGNHKLEIRQVGGDGKVVLSRIITYK